MSGNRRKESDVFGTVAEVQASTHLKVGTVITVHDDYDYDVRSTITGADIVTSNGLGCFIRTSSSSAPVTSVQGRTGDVVITTTDLSLQNVDNTSDTDKPVSTAQQTALDGKVDKEVGKGLSEENYTLTEKNKLAGVGEGAQLVSVVAGVNISVDNTDPQNPVVNSSGGGATSWGGIGGTLSDQTDLQAALDNKADISALSSLKTRTVKTTDNTGELPNWAAWVVDTTAPRTRAMPSSPTDGEEVTVFDGNDGAETNNVTLTVVPPTTITKSSLTVNGEAIKLRYDAVGDVWDLVFRNAPTGGTGQGYQVEMQTLYISDGLISETDTGATLSADQREVIDIATYLGADWVSEELWIKTEVFNDTGSGASGWSSPEFVNNAGGYGVRASRKENEIIVQSGSASPLGGSSNNVGNAFGSSVASPSAIKTRVKVIRLTYPNGFDLVDVAVLDAGVVATNNRYTFTISSTLGPSWNGADILMVCQIQNGLEWGDPQWVYDGGSFGVTAAMLNSNEIVIQTGNTGVVAAAGGTSGHPFGTTVAPASAFCRVLCYKFAQGAISDGIVRSDMVDLGSVADDTRIVTPMSVVGLDFLGKEVEALCEVEQPVSEWGKGGWYTISTLSLGCRSNQMYDAIVTQSGSDSITSIPLFDGSPHSNTNYTANRYLAPTRLRVWRFG